MKTKERVFKISGFFLLMLLLVSIGFAGPPTLMKKTVPDQTIQTPAPPVKDIQPQPKKIYSITIEEISLTSRCQPKFVLKNSGSGLTDDQFTNSSVKIGQDQTPPTPFNTIDPGGRLKTRGGTITYIQYEPLTEDVNMAIEVILFNGSRKSGEKLLKPTCETAKKRLAAQTSSSAMGAKPLTAPVPKTFLEVKCLGREFETWDDAGSTDTSQQRMDFRWKTNITTVNTTRWEAALTPNFSSVVARAAIPSIPQANNYGYFPIDFAKFSESYPKPISFFVRVVPTSSSGVASSLDEEYAPSAVVKITIVQAGSGEQTQFGSQ